MSDKKKAKSKKKPDYENVDIRTLPKDQRPKPTSGQSAEAFTLGFDDLTKFEAKVIKVVNGEGKGTRPVMNIEAISKQVRLSKLATRNTIRRLVPSNWLERVEDSIDDDGNPIKVRGHYRITKGGRERVSAALDG